MVKKKLKNENLGIGNKLRLIVKSGKFSIGYKSTINKLKEGKCILILVADNCPPVRRLELEYYAMLNNCSIHHYLGNNSELGVACGKIFRCSCLGIMEPGDADLSPFLKNI